MNDNDIIKALELCISGEKCNDKCPYHKYSHEVHCAEQNWHDLLDLINRQKAEIADLKAKEKICAEVIARQDKEIENLSKAVDTYESCLKCVEVIRANAIKEFAEQLNKQAFYVQQTEWEGRVVNCEYIDALVKEMTEDIDGNV